MKHLKLTLGLARPLPKKKETGKPVKPKKKQKKGDGPAAPDFVNGKLNPEIRNRIFERDDYTCQCCGFRSQKYQEIHFRDRNLKNTDEANLATTCIFCHQCFNLETVGEMRSGVLLWLPEIEQYRLHHIARAIYVARIAQGPVSEAARSVLDIIMERRNEAKRRISTDDPYILATVLQDYLGPRHYAERTKKLEGIRLFPLDRRIIREADLEFNQFPQILAYWRSKNGPFGGKVPQNWISIYHEALRQQA